MANFHLPYGRTGINVEIPDDRLAAVLRPANPASLIDSAVFEDSAPLAGPAKGRVSRQAQESLVRQALSRPLGSAALSELARDKKDIVIISSDHTRPMPSLLTMPLLLEEIRGVNSHCRITILIATGFHRATTREELIERFGQSVVDSVEILIHVSDDYAAMADCGTLPSGVLLQLNKRAIEADLLLAEGFIEPHPFAGFSGGRKSVLPGIASKKTVMANHCAQFISHLSARSGVLEGNPLHQDMLYAAKAAKLAYILNVVMNEEHDVIAAFAGDPVEAHLAGCRLSATISGVNAVPAPIILSTSSGYPLDRDIYQTAKGMISASLCAPKGSVIIMLSDCCDGHGSQDFFDLVAKSGKSLQEIHDEICLRKAEETVPDQWMFQLYARVLLNHPVVVVTKAPRELVEAVHLRWAPDPEAAIALATELAGDPMAKITVIPDGNSIVVYP